MCAYLLLNYIFSISEKAVSSLPAILSLENKMEKEKSCYTDIPCRQTVLLERMCEAGTCCNKMFLFVVFTCKPVFQLQKPDFFNGLQSPLLPCVTTQEHRCVKLCSPRSFPLCKLTDQSMRTMESQEQRGWGYWLA